MMQGSVRLETKGVLVERKRNPTEVFWDYDIQVVEIYAAQEGVSAEIGERSGNSAN